MENGSGAFGPTGWAALHDDVRQQMEAWRAQHPRATLSEIEAELDRRLAGVRARLLEQLAHQSPGVAGSAEPAEQREGSEPRETRCPGCGSAMQPRGRRTRRLKTQGDQVLTLRREYWTCPTCGQGLFPPG